jgi:hypothetical protein
MAFVVETGTALSTSNAYVSLTDYRTYLLDRGIDEGDTDDDLIRAAIIKATDYIDRRFRFKGLRVDPDTPQALAWPRKEVYDREGYLLASDVIPVALKQAAIEYAYRARTEELWNVPTLDAAGTLNAKREKVGPIETEYQYSSGFASTIKPYPQADSLLRDLILAEQGRTYR